MKEARPAQNLSRNARIYTSEQIELMKESCQDYLYYFSYVDHPTDADPDTVFFKYADGNIKHD